ncbi:MAG: PEP-CTERM sorting domain-containing protein [Acidobacteria bacterium]|nr:PEP-CTERM sorting domain-containing protein [Acidobacteriota bacterium]
MLQRLQLLFLLCAAIAQAGPIWETGGLSLQQTNYAILDVPGDTKIWQTMMRITNNNPFPVYQAGFVNYAERFNGTYATWNDTTHTWDTPDNSGDVIESRHLPESLSTTSPFGFGVDSSSSPAMRGIGDLAPGESVDVVWMDEVSDAVNDFWFYGQMIYRRDAPLYSRTNISGQQTLLSISDMEGGTKLWKTRFLWTNNTQRTLDLMLLVYAVTLNGELATYDNAAGRFNTGNLSNKPVNPNNYMPLSQTDVNVFTPGVDRTSKLPTFAIGILNPGQSTYADTWFEMDDSVNTFNYYGTVIASDVPEPGAFALAALGLAVVTLRGYSRQAKR